MSLQGLRYTQAVTDAEFSDALGKALGVCRDAAGLKLPIEAMLDSVENEEPFTAEAAALLEILSAVADVAAIGASLPPEEKTAEPPPCPLPANLLGSTR